MIKTEIWNGHKIRFVEKEQDDWWTVAKDVSEALGYKHTPHLTRRLDSEEKDTVLLTDSVGRRKKMIIISEVGFYEAIFGSELEQTKDFKKWVKRVIKELRQLSGLEGFQMFRMVDKEHQKETMQKLKMSINKPAKVNFIKANTIANKVISTKYGLQKMINKKNMTPKMLIDRQPILENTVNLMGVIDEFGLNISVSEEIYKKYLQ
ncbi:BRO family protein [Sporosarcina psychrophila]|uniref:BRO-N domain-containing protein n=1 Tax=Sporosarcina psychrophila TaxID=1476 RepID=UPI0030CC0D6D